MRVKPIVLAIAIVAGIAIIPAFFANVPSRILDDDQLFGKQNPSPNNGAAGVNPDLESIVISGVIFSNDTTIIDPWYRVEQSPDIPLGNPGNVTIVYLDGNGEVIGQTAFDASLQVVCNGHCIVNDFADFGLRIPDVEHPLHLRLRHQHQRQLSPLTRRPRHRRRLPCQQGRRRQKGPSYWR